MLNLPSATATAIVQVDLTTAGASITATTSDGMGGCMVETTIELRSATGSLGRRTFSANGCAGIRFPADSWARDLEAKTYFIVVGNNGMTTGPVQLDVGVVQPMCGDRVIQARANEVCDDGNRADGDGCSSTCQFEGSITPEVEPNNDLMGAQASGATVGQTVTLSGSVDPIGDSDWFSFSVASGTATLIATTYGTPGNHMTCNGDTKLYLMDSMGMELTNDDDGGTFPCSNLDGTTDMDAAGLTPGTYYIRVQHWNNTNTVASYLLDIQLQ